MYQPQPSGAAESVALATSGRRSARSINGNPVSLARRGGSVESSTRMDTREPIRLPTRDVVRVLALIFGFYIAVRLLWIAHPVIFLFFLGVLFGLPLSQGADWFQKRRIPRAVGVAVILTLFLGLLIGGGAAMAPIL